MMKRIFVYTVCLLLVVMKVWSFGRSEISEEERARLDDDHRFAAYPLSEWIGITEEIQKLTFSMKIHRTSRRYRIGLHFTNLSWDKEGYQLLRDSLEKVYLFVVEDVKTGRVISWHNDNISFTGSIGLIWWLESGLRLRRNREYRVHLTLPGIENTPKELEDIELLCHIPPRPMP